jgi:hypothetical protein
MIPYTQAENCSLEQYQMFTRYIFRSALSEEKNILSFDTEKSPFSPVFSLVYWLTNHPLISSSE